MAGVYYLRIHAKSRNFPRHSLLSLTAEGPGVQLIDRTVGDTVAIPADNSRVLTVGAADVNYGGRRVAQGRLIKPDLVVPSRVRFADGQVVHGTSAASAIAAGALVGYLMRQTRVGSADLGNLLRSGQVTRASPPKCPHPYCLEAPILDFSRTGY